MSIQSFNLTKNEWLALLIPIIALLLHTLSWEWVKPHIWFAFYTSLYFSAKIGGQRGGIYATIFTAILVYFFEMKPLFCLVKNNFGDYVSMTFFVFVGIAISITQGKLNKRLTELKIASVAFQSNEGIMITDEKQIILKVNKAYCNLSGYDSSKLIGKHSSIMKSGIQNEDFYNSMWNKLSQEKTWNGELINRKKNGDTFTANLLITIISDDNQKITNYVALMTDITAQKQVQEELKKAKHTAELATQAKSEFLANMSHEIRTPMNAIIGLSKLALMDDLSPKHLNYIQKIHKSSKSLLGILNDILDYSKMEAGKLEIVNSAFNLYEILQDLHDIFSFKAEEKGIDFAFLIDSNHTRFVGDSLRITQVLTNLISNAMKFTEKGSVKVKVNYTDKKLKFEVIDTGIGMNSEQAKELFTAFHQADSSITRKYGGTGLGLSISKGLVSLMGGKIGFTSEEFVGTTFWFEIEVEEGVNNTNGTLPKIQEMNILVVDDSAIVRDSISSILESWSAKVHTAQNGEEAISKINEQEFDLVISDWKMPIIDGITLFNICKSSVESGIIPKMPIVIMVTGYEKDELLKNIEENSINGVLTKPVTPSNLYTLIESINGCTTETQFLPQKASETIHFNSVKILLVEDNLINQEVASEFLRKFGCNVIIASNGYEAINIIDNSFDIVLMDLQMPGIDGFETTKRIRKIYPNLPIIAMTAAVMQKDIEQCNNAGMNGHISKPFEISDMLATISKWIPDKIINDKVAIIESDTKLHIDYLDTDYAMKLFKDKDFYISILKKFEKTYKDKAEIIQNMLFNNDIKTAKEELHTLKGVSGNIGATELNKICSALEKSISVDSDLMVLKNELHLICSEISKIEVKQNNQYNSFDKEKALLVIDKFIFDIAESNIISKDDIDNFKNTLGDYADDELFSSFFNAIDSFDYSDASILLIQIKNIISK